MSILAVIGRGARRACAAAWCRRYARAALLAAAALALALLSTTSYLIPRIEGVEERLVDVSARLQFLTALYWARLEDLLALEVKISNGSADNETARNASAGWSPELASVVGAHAGMRALEGLEPRALPQLRSAFAAQLLPFAGGEGGPGGGGGGGGPGGALAALRPAYHLRSARAAVDTVIGVPTVRRDHETYITITLSHIIKGMTRAQRNDTLIVVLVGETDLLYVLNTAILIEKSFPKYVRSGLVEVVAPPRAYYPPLHALAPTLGDSPRRFRWRTKQNLDALYLMAYAHSRGAYYLMLEDDVIARKFFMTEMKHFRTEMTLKLPQWFYIEFCPSGGIGKLFRAAALRRFLVYVQLFYDNAPIDWLLESYVADKACTDDKFSFKSSNYPKFFPHANPPLARAHCSMQEFAGHSLLRAYRGETFFWAQRPSAGDVLEFWFLRPTRLQRYLIRSGNAEHRTDRAFHGVVEVLATNDSAWRRAGDVDEFGLADGELGPPTAGPPAPAPALRALRLRLTRDNPYALLISEIDLRAADEPAAAAASGEPAGGR